MLSDTDEQIHTAELRQNKPKKKTQLYKTIKSAM